MKCKHCQAELEDGATVCGACGKEIETPEVTEEVTAVEEAPVEETPAEEPAVQEEAPAQEAAPVEKTDMKEGMKVTPGKLALAIVAGVVLLAVLVALVVSGIDGVTKPLTADSTDAATVATDVLETEPVETVPATIPADGNPDDVTCKGSYTVTDDEVIAAADDVVATMGDKVLTVADLQVYYWMEVSAFLNEYGDYSYYFGMDYTQPLDTQLCEDGSENPVTWQQYFLQSALDSWMCYEALGLEADAAGFQMGEEYVTYLEELPEMLDTNAVSFGLSDAEELVRENVGAGADLEDYLRYMEEYYKGFTYYNELYSQIQPTDAEIEAYFTENEEYYFNEQGVTREDGKYIDVRHVLLMPEDENATTGEDGYPVYSDESWEACRVEAEALYEQWKAGDMSEESFAQLAMDYSVDGSAADGGLYTEVTEGYMVETFNDWCFDATRQTGDHGLVKTQYGYHLMYFVGSQEIWFATAKDDLLTERASTLIPAAMEKHPATIDYSAIKLGLVDLTQE